MNGIHNAHVMVDGTFVSQKITQVIRAIQEYEPQVEVKWIRPGDRQPGEAAFALIHNVPGQDPYVIFYVNTEEEFDERVYMKLVQNDQRRGERKLSDLDAYDAAQKAIMTQAKMDQMEEANDIAFHLLRTNKNTYKVNDNLIIRSDTPYNVAHRN